MAFCDDNLISRCRLRGEGRLLEIDFKNILVCKKVVSFVISEKNIKILI